MTSLPAFRNFTNDLTEQDPVFFFKDKAVGGSLTMTSVKIEKPG